MTSLESIVLPLAESRALVERGIVLETVASWITDGATHSRPVIIELAVYETVKSRIICPAPTLSELLDAIRAKVGGNETTAILSRDKSEAGASCAGIRTEGGRYEIAQALTDLLAAAALLMGASK
jgi:hypothetical protein